MKRSSSCLAAAVACLVFAAVAVAAGSDFSALSKRSASKPLTNPGQNATASIDCTGGKAAVSGGFDGGVVSFTHGPVVTASRAKGDGWSASANEFASSTASDRITGDVNCASKVPKITKRSVRTSLAPGQLKSVKAKCPGDKNVVAGGFKTRYFGGGPVAGAIVSASYRSGAQAWKVTATAVNGSDARGRQRLSASSARGTSTPLKAYAYCASVSPLHSASKSAVGSNNHNQVVAIAKCAKHQTVVSGGFKSAIDRGPSFNEANLPEASGLKGKAAWKTRAYYFSLSGSPLKWKAYAYCAA